MIAIVPFQKRVAPFYRPRLQEAWRARRRRCRGWRKRLYLRGSPEVDIAGGREVELIGVCELHVLGLITCVGCDIVQADHAPDGGVAQGIIHEVLRQAPWQESGRGGRRTWAGGKRTGGRRRSRNNQVHMHGWDEVK